MEAASRLLRRLETPRTTHTSTLPLASNHHTRAESPCHSSPRPQTARPPGRQAPHQVSAKGPRPPSIVASSAIQPATARKQRLPGEAEHHASHFPYRDSLSPRLKCRSLLFTAAQKRFRFLLASARRVPFCLPAGLHRIPIRTHTHSLTTLRQPCILQRVLYQRQRVPTPT